MYGGRIMKEDQEQIRQFEEDLKSRQVFLFYAWGINIGFVFIFWLFGFSDSFMNFVANMFEISLQDLHKDWINWITVWNIAGIILFLIPGLATFWSRHSLRKPV